MGREHKHVVPRAVRAVANEIAKDAWPGPGREAIRADIRDAYINGWLDGKFGTAPCGRRDCEVCVRPTKGEE